MTLTQRDLYQIEETLKGTFVTKDDFTEYESQLFDKLDQIVKNTSNQKVEVDLVENRLSKLEDQVALT